MAAPEQEDSKRWSQKIKSIWRDQVWSKIIANSLWTIICVAAALLLGIYLSFRGKSPNDPRLAALDESTWQGETSAIFGAGESGTTNGFSITFKFSIRNGKIVGRSFFDHDNRHFETAITGELVNESYLKLEYHHLKAVNAFGFIIMKLDDIPTAMSGKCVVYGSVTHEISVGKITLKKVVE